MCVFTRADILALRQPVNLTPISSDTLQSIRRLGIGTVNKTKRGCRAGRLRQTNTNTDTAGIQCHETGPRASVANSPLVLETPNSPSVSMKCCLINTQSARNKCLKLTDFTSDGNYDLVALTETWFRENGDEFVIKDCTPTGYIMAYVPRGDRDGGGVAFLYKEGLQLRTSKLPFAYQSLEVFEAKLDCSSRRIDIVLVYRPPPSPRNGLNFSMFMSDLSALLESYVCESKHFLALGDFNVHMDDLSDRETIQLNDLLDSFNLTQHVTEPTHIKGHMLDLVLTNSSKLVENVNVNPYRLSDHFIVEFDLAARKANPLKQTISYRKLRSVDLASLKADIVSCLQVDQNMDVFSAYSAYHSTLSGIIDKHAPLKRKEIVIRPESPWYNDATLSAKRKRRQLERRWRLTKSHADRVLYKNQCDTVNDLVDSSKSAYYSERILDCGTDQKALFRIISKLLHRENNNSLPKHESLSELSEQFSHYFVQKIRVIREGLSSHSQNVDVPLEITVPSTRLVTFHSCTEDEIIKILNRSPSKHCLLDPIPTWLLKDCMKELTPAITTIVNQSLSSGTVPCAMKSAIVKPLLKKPQLDPNDLKNYRPVSNLPFVSKVIERVVALQLNTHLEQNHLLDPLQSAYRPKHSTETALLRVHSDIADAVDKGHCVILILLDLSAAFDTIDHAKLLARLEACGVSGLALSWFKSYLEDRVQSVNVNGVSSSNQALTCGVPQGSVLGPILFTIYIMELGKLIRQHDINYHQYADDNQMYLVVQPKLLSSAYQKVESCCLDVKQWMIQNLLKLNDSKTEFILIRSRFMSSRLDLAPMTVGSCQIQPTESARNIGVIFDEFLSHKQHVSGVVKSVFFHVSNIWRIRKFLTEDAAARVVHALVTSRLDNCNAMLYGLPDAAIKKLQRAQNAAARLVKLTKKSDHITPVLKSLHWLPVRFRIIYKILVTVFKALNGTVPNYLSELLEKRHCTRMLRSSNQIVLCEPKTKLKSYGDRAFKNCAPRLWNKLPQQIKLADTFVDFKAKLKTHLFEQAYNR